MRGLIDNLHGARANPIVQWFLSRRPRQDTAGASSVLGPKQGDVGTDLHHPIIRYGVALGVTALAAGLRGVLGAQFPGLVPFATFFPAVLIVTLLVGLGPGVLAVVVSAFLSWFFWLQPTAELAPPTAAVTLNLVLFVLASLVSVATAEAARRYYDRSLAGERRFRAAEDLASDGFGILEAVRDHGGSINDFRWRYVNPALATMLHHSSDDLIGRNLVDPLPGYPTHPVFFSSCLQVARTGEPSEAEAFCDANGMRGWFHVSAVKLDDGVALSLRDVTSRKEREDALRETEERFRLLADAVDDVFWILDLRRRKVVYVSPAYERVWGFSRDALERNPTAWREHLYPEDRALADPVFEEMLHGHRQTFELVYRMQRADGEWRWVRDKAWLVRAGETERVVGVMTDITAEKGSEEKHRLVARELDHRLKNTFAMVQSIVRLSARSARDLEEFAEGLEGRIQAMARSQEAVVKGSQPATLLEDIIRDSLAPHRGREDRIQVTGPPIEIGAREVPLLHMGFHELATNAAKYGALSVPGGKVSVDWQTISDAQGHAVQLTWAESGGPVVRPPVRRGFGSTLVEHALASEFAGEIKISFPPHGVICTMRLPISDRLTIRSDAA